MNFSLVGGNFIPGKEGNTEVKSEEDASAERPVQLGIVAT